MSALNGWLTGTRVLDLSSYLPGPLATLFLADFGADVLKVEAPRGDELHNLGPRDAQGRPIYYPSVNAGKSVRRMDLKDAAVRGDFLRLVDEADVLLETFRPGVMARLSLDYPTLSARNPRLVYCSINGYGVGSTLEPAAGHDINYLALAGVLERNGAASPVNFDPPVADTAGSLFAVIAILGALRGRERSGHGCMIDIALADVAQPLQAFRVADYGARGRSPSRNEAELNGGAAYYRVYATRDVGHVALGAIEPKFWTSFCNAAGHPEWGARHSEALPQHALTRDVAAFFAGVTLDECIARFAAADCCLTPVLTVAEALQSGHVRERGLVRRGAGGDLQALFPARVDGEPPALRSPVRDAES
jgi:crotonobetainyl-CoA:carnitine CoA-transferase CaiB-like acyl-CoA transferase